MALLEALRGANAALKDKEGKTALDYALEGGHKPIIQWIMREGGATD